MVPLCSPHAHYLILRSMMQFWSNSDYYLIIIEFEIDKYKYLVITYAFKNHGIEPTIATSRCLISGSSLKAMLLRKTPFRSMEIKLHNASESLTTN